MLTFRVQEVGIAGSKIYSAVVFLTKDDERADKEEMEKTKLYYDDEYVEMGKLYDLDTQWMIVFNTFRMREMKENQESVLKVVNEKFTKKLGVILTPAVRELK